MALAPPSPYNRCGLGKVAIDIGCGNRKHSGAFGVDIARLKTVDVLADVRLGLPFRDNSIDVVYASHVLEHFEDLVRVLEEIWRVCRPGGRVHITVPHASSSYMLWRDPTHRRGILLSTLDYFDKTQMEGNMFQYYTPTNFRRVYARLRFVAGGSTGRYAGGRRLAVAIFTDLLEAVANSSKGAQRVCERWWGQMFGVAEAYVILEAVK